MYTSYIVLLLFGCTWTGVKSSVGVLFPLGGSVASSLYGFWPVPGMIRIVFPL